MARTQWTGSVAPEAYAGKSVPWVVGVSHLAGLLVNLRRHGWTATSFVQPRSGAVADARTDVPAPARDQAS